MRSRKSLIGSAGTFLAVTAGVALWLAVPGRYFSDETYRRLKVATTEAEVIDIVGYTPGNYRSLYFDPTAFDRRRVNYMADGACFDVNDDGRLDIPLPPARTVRTWLIDRQSLRVVLDANGGATGVQLLTYERDSFFERARLRLRL